MDLKGLSDKELALLSMEKDVQLLEAMKQEVLSIGDNTTVEEIVKLLDNSTKVKEVEKSAIPIDNEWNERK